MKKEFLEVLKKTTQALPIISKNKSVDFKSTHYTYAPLDKIWDEVKAVLTGNGFVITNDITLEGVRTTATHELGELTSITPFSNTISRPQERGAEITYYRRYNLTAMFNIIVAGEDNELLLEKAKVVKEKLTPMNLTKEKFEKLKETDKQKFRDYFAKKLEQDSIDDEQIYIHKNWK